MIAKNFPKIFKGLFFILTALAVFTQCTSPKTVKNSYPISPVLFTDVQITDPFWLDRIETNREVTIPFSFDKCETEGRVRNFERAAGVLNGKYEGYMPFDDTDVYKIIEGASYSLTTHPDSVLENYLDELIEKIVAAQEEDGYLCTWKTIDPDTTPAWWVKPGPRWHDLGSSHELYNAGHMYEAAAAHYYATGKTNFLNVALKNADLMVNTFGPDKLQNIPGHQIVETGLVKLYDITGNKKYLDLTKYFLDQRGQTNGRELYGAYSQDHKPVVEQDEAVGHAVRAVYMYAGMTDIAAIMQDSLYLNAVEKIWDNVVNKKIYITGGTGALHDGEAFGENYELPNLTSYNETCAAIGNIYWNHRLFLLKGESKYMDVLEQTLYNGMISGVSLHGDSFFYPNCLESDGKYKFNRGALSRQPWFDCSCCPSNVARFIPSVPGYIYAQKGDDFYVNLYISSKTTATIKKNPVAIELKSNYPWEGGINLAVDPDKDTQFSLMLRIPGWAHNQPLPGELYHYKTNVENTIKVLVNGEIITAENQNGYVVIDRTWSKGDLVQVELAMPVRRVVASDSVEADRGKVALTRGPLVYCAEWIDNGGKVLDINIPESAELNVKTENILDQDMTIITGEVRNNKGRKRQLKAIPYYAWSHRGSGEMKVWFPER